MGMIQWILLFLCHYISMNHGFKIHEHMTKEEIKSVFNVELDAVNKLEYEISPIFHIDEIESRRQRRRRNSRLIVHVKAFKQNYTLYLENNDQVLLGNNTPVYLADVDARHLREGYNEDPSIKYARVSFPNPSNIKLYHDIKNRAALTVYTDADRKAHINGIIGDDIVIRSLPERLHNEILHEYANLSENFNVSGSYRSTLHAILKSPFLEDQVRESSAEICHLLPPPRIVDRLATIELLSSQPKYSPIDQSNTVYPEILLVVDYKTVSSFGGNIDEITRYVAAFWNAVDLRFRELSSPKVRLNIAGLIIPKQENATYFMSRHKFSEDVLKSDDTLEALGKYFAIESQSSHNSNEDLATKEKFGFKYDIVVGMTHHDIKGYVRDENTNSWNYRPIYGVAYLGQACNKNGLAAALVRDRAGFNGVTTAAHEIAHTLNAPHDGVGSKNIPGGPCPSEDGYLMSYNRIDANGVHWSHCSMTAMQKFIRSNSGACLRNRPEIGKSHPKVLPGKLLTRDEQCRRSFSDDSLFASKSAEKNCALLFCEKRIEDPRRKEPYVIDYVTTTGKPPAEGSFCGSGAICLDAECVWDPEV